MSAFRIVYIRTSLSVRYKTVLFPFDAVAFLREVERVLIPERGVFNFSVRYFSSLLQAQRTPDGRQLARLLRPHR